MGRGGDYPVQMIRIVRYRTIFADLGTSRTFLSQFFFLFPRAMSVPCNMHGISRPPAFSVRFATYFFVSLLPILISLRRTATELRLVSAARPKQCCSLPRSETTLHPCFFFVFYQPHSFFRVLKLRPTFWCCIGRSGILIPCI